MDKSKADREEEETISDGQMEVAMKELVGFFSNAKDLKGRQLALAKKFIEKRKKLAEGRTVGKEALRLLLNAMEASLGNPDFDVNKVLGMKEVQRLDDLKKTLAEEEKENEERKKGKKKKKGKKREKEEEEGCFKSGTSKNHCQEEEEKEQMYPPWDRLMEFLDNLS